MTGYGPTMASKKYELKKLNKDNYDIWFFSLKNAIMGEKLVYLLDSSDKDSDVIQQDWDRDTGRGISILIPTFSDNDTQLILNINNLKDMVSKLSSKYKRSVNCYSLNQELVNLKRSKDQTADDFISKLDSIKLKMESLNVNDESRFTQKLVEQIPGFLHDLKSNYQIRIIEDQDNITHFTIFNIIFCF